MKYRDLLCYSIYLHGGLKFFIVDPFFNNQKKKDCFRQGHLLARRELQGFSQADYLTSVNREISQQLLKVTFPKEVKTVIKSWFIVMGGK